LLREELALVVSRVGEELKGAMGLVKREEEGGNRPRKGVDEYME